MLNTNIMATFISNFASELNIKAIASLTTKESKANRQAFNYTLEAAHKVASSLSWWKETGKALAKEQGYTPTADQLSQDLYGWQKSFMYKMAKAGSLPSDTIESYVQACIAVEEQGKRAEWSIAALLKFAKAGNEEGGGEEGDEEGGEATPEKVKPIITFTCRLADLGIADANLSLRIDADGNVTTTASADDIQKAINILTTALAPKQ